MWNDREETQNKYTLLVLFQLGDLSNFCYLSRYDMKDIYVKILLFEHLFFSNRREKLVLSHLIIAKYI